jgi:hypothetical protein
MLTVDENFRLIGKAMTHRAMYTAMALPQYNIWRSYMGGDAALFSGC